MRAAAVAQAEVVACTLSAAGGDLVSLLPPGVGFDALICDEAAQAREGWGLWQEYMIVVGQSLLASRAGI